MGSPGLKRKGHAPTGNTKSVATDPFSMGEIQKRAETVSPFLQQILDFRPPQRWGLNE